MFWQSNTRQHGYMSDDLEGMLAFVGYLKHVYIFLPNHTRFLDPYVLRVVHLAPLRTFLSGEHQIESSNVYIADT